MKYYISYIFSLIIFVVFCFINFDFLSSVAISIFSFWVSSLVLRMNDCLPFKELFLCLYGLNFLFSPAMTYHVLESFTFESYLMKISSDEYFKFTIPVFLAFNVGFNVFIKAYSLKIDLNRLNIYINKYPNLAYYFIILGFFAPIFNIFLPKSLIFLSYLLSSFKFIGIFVMLLGFKKQKPLLLFAIYGFLIFDSFIAGLFHDLLIWLIITGLFVAYRFKPEWWLKLIYLSSFIIFVIFIQSIKSSLRQATWYDQEEFSVEIIQDANSTNIESKDGFFSLNNIGPQFIRVNQGWILASTIAHVPKYVGHTYGKLTIDYLYSAIMPRIFVPNKLEAGDTKNFVYFTNHDVTGSTMALGLFTDAYIEFGKYGAIFYVFIFGLFYGFVMKQLMIRSYKFPLVIFFSGLVFSFALRPDVETSTALGHLFKMIILLFIIFNLLKKYFVFPR